MQARELGSVLLRAVLDSDLLIFFEHQLDPVATQMAAFPARDRDAFMDHWAKIRAEDTNILRTIVFDGQVAGNIVSREQAGRRQVGYWLGKDFWGQGIATRALAAFTGDVSVRPLFAHVAKHNVASRRVLEKCGFTVESEDRDVSSIMDHPVEEYLLKLG